MTETLTPLEAARRGARQSRFAKKPLDAYDTIDPRAVAALLPQLQPRTRFIEPCAGKGDLVQQLEAAGHVDVDRFDIAPRADWIRQEDAREWKNPLLPDQAMIITNPPFGWPLVGDLIRHWSTQVSLQWLLLEADSAHTKRFGPLMLTCRKIVSIGRLRWVEGSDHGSTKNYAWYQFGTTAPPHATAQFYGRGWKPIGSKA